MLIFETLALAFDSLRANKLRAGLTILGIVVGIFSIVVIMTVITMLQNSIESGVSQLSQNTFQIQKFPAMQGGGPGSRAKYRNRKDITLEEYTELKSRLVSAKFVGAEQWQFAKIIKYESEETNPNVQVAGITPEAQYTNEWVVQEGREIRENDVRYSNDVMVLGKDVADKLFPILPPVGQIVKVDGRPFRVIGVYEQQGQIFGQSRDNFVVTPISTFQGMYGKYRRSLNITVTSFGKHDYNAVIEAATGHMRAIRKVEPGKDNDFEVWSNESILQEINSVTQYVSLGAFIVSGIALLAAGVGIMNIMLVSVTERTKEIGIRKAIGAKKKNILMQFLIEAIVLCLFGGIVGIVMGVGVGNLAGGFLNATMAIPWSWVIFGLVTCIVVGLLFGTYPAYKASNLDPIEALRFE